MKKVRYSFVVFLSLFTYLFSGSIFVHAESMKNMNMGGMDMGMMNDYEDCMMLAGKDGEINKGINENSLDCLEMCVGEYDEYFVSQIFLEDSRVFEKICYGEENIFEEKGVIAFRSDTDPPGRIGNISENDFHKILVKIE